MKRELTYIVLIILFSGCVKEYDQWVPETTIDLIAVEATLTDELKRHEVKLTRVNVDLNQIPAVVSGAQVIISNEDDDWVLTEDPQSPGTYLSDSTVIGRLNRNYNLQIFYNSKLYTAKSAMSPPRYFSELTYVKEDNGLFRIDFVASAFATTNPAMWEVIIDWHGVPGFENQDPDSCHARMLFYSLTTLDVSEIFAPEVEKIYFPVGSLIVQRRYSLTPEHEEYIRTLLLETTWQGSLFPGTNANVSTNLSAGATGFFGVCGVTELSLTVNSK
ncbi:MAG: DUF4249 domain-containing protein [Bacteroidetes bacterium]|nr:DUF4249 domain-containing protein [Bacteroidota bacterium]